MTYGRDLTLHDFRSFYDAVIFSTGAIKDADLNIPGIELEGSFGGADFVSWYDGHPDVPREWPLDAKEVAVIGNGNVALDVARMLSKHADDLLVTEIPDNVYAALKASPVTDVHVFGRRGPPRSSSLRWSCANSRTPTTWTLCCTRKISSLTKPRTRPSAATTRSRPWSTR
ncbi:NADPH-ferredoxin reductase FprA [Arthrobacter sp. Hiyo8]|nr:NADPH-ferredoxin reductase FprA [Arthrobacter sp. Hiyo8]